MQSRWLLPLALVILSFCLYGCSSSFEETLYFLTFSRQENRGELWSVRDSKPEKVLEKKGLVDFAIQGEDIYLLTRSPTKSELFLKGKGEETLIKESTQTMILLKPNFPEAPLALREIGKEQETLHLLASEGIQASYLLPKGALPMSVSPKKELALRVWENTGKKRTAKIYLMDLNEERPALFRPQLTGDSSEEFLSWSPQGEGFLFQKRGASGVYSLFIYDLNEKGERLFKEEAFSFQGALTGGESWSRDGHIIYSEGSQKAVFSDICLALEEKEWHVGVQGASPYLSPDGGILSFATPSHRSRPGENALPQADLGLYFLKEGKALTVKLEGDCLSPVSASWSDSSRFFAFVTYLWDENKGPAGFKLYLYLREESICQDLWHDPSWEILALGWK